MEKVKVIPEALYFLKPVNKKSVKNYYDVIKNPMDLETMEKLINGSLLLACDLYLNVVLVILQPAL